MWSRSSDIYLTSLALQPWSGLTNLMCAAGVGAPDMRAAVGWRG